jgi:hypothetical protein
MEEEAKSLSTNEFLKPFEKSTIYQRGAERTPEDLVQAPAPNGLTLLKEIETWHFA